MRYYLIPAIIFLCLITTGCEQNNDNHTLSSLEQKIAQQQNDIDQLKKEVLDNSRAIYNASIVEGAKHITMFTPNLKEFQPIETGLGILFVKLVDIKPYANGYKLTIAIGNPNNAIFSNLDIGVTYGKGNDQNTTLNIDSSKRHDTTILRDLLPGYWTEETIILSPANKNDLGHIWITVSPNSTKLKSQEKSNL